MGSFIAIVSFWHFNLIFGKLQEKQQEIADQDEEKADRKQGGAEQESETRMERGQRPSESGAIEEGDYQGKNGKP